jgi:hypothetical protein
MRVFTIGMLLSNLGVAGWLIAVASMEWPPWEHAFENTRQALDCMGNGDEAAAVRRTRVDLARMHLGVTETWTRAVMDEHQRSEVVLWLLTMGNIAGLAVMSFGR